MIIIFLFILHFLCGSLMFSYWLGLLLKRNLRDVGDGNPGAANLWKSAGYRYGIAGVVLDFLKGYLPLFLLIESGRHLEIGLFLLRSPRFSGMLFHPFLNLREGKESL